MTFYAFDIDLDPMTLILKFDLDMSKISVYYKIKFLALAIRKL